MSNVSESSRGKKGSVSGRKSHGFILIGRVVLDGQPTGYPEDGEDLLLQVLNERWPEGLKITFLITPGGFVAGDFPEDWEGGAGWNSESEDLDALLEYAEEVLGQTITNRVIESAKGKVDFITVGVDLNSEEIKEHAELVAVYDVTHGKVFWTGKSYPTSYQEGDLVQVVDLNSHFLTIADERVLVLGCHDLNMFSPRGNSNLKKGSDREIRVRKMTTLVRKFKPTIVLHHPHATDTPNIWRDSWNRLAQDFPGLKAWASGISYFYGEDEPPRGTLGKVLSATQGGSSPIDFVVSP